LYGTGALESASVACTTRSSELAFSKIFDIVDVMPALKNQKHETFAQAVALGMPQGQAYMEHVSPSGCTENNAYVRASELCREGSKVAVRIAELRKEVGKAADKKFGLTKDIWLERLVTIADKAEGAKDFSAAQNALDKVGKASAWYAPEEMKHSGTIEIPGLADAVAATFGRK
jgi:hypothetical protein